MNENPNIYNKYETFHLGEFIQYENPIKWQKSLVCYWWYQPDIEMFKKKQKCFHNTYFEHVVMVDVVSEHFELRW